MEASYDSIARSTPMFGIFAGGENIRRKKNLQTEGDRNSRSNPRFGNRA